MATATSPAGPALLPDIHDRHAGHQPAPPQQQLTIRGDTSAPYVPEKVDVGKLATFEIMEMLRDRNEVPSGFYEDDKNKLQGILDAEHEAAASLRESYYADIAAAKHENVRAALELRKLQRQNVEQEAFLAKNPHIAAWVENMRNGTCAKYFSLANTKIPGIRYVLNNIPTACPLRVLDMHSCNMADDTGLMLASVLKSNRCIESVDLSENQLGSEALAELSASLEVNDVVKGFNIAHNPLHRGGTEGVQAFARMLRTNQSLLHVNILGTGLTREELHPIAQAMEINHCILVLDLDHAAMALDDSRAVAGSVQRNRSLKKRRQQNAREEKLVQRKEELAEEKRLQEEQEARDHEAWIKQQRRDRMCQRREILARAHEETVRQEALAKAQREEQIRMALAESGKKKKKKKGKGKKKKKK